MKWINVKDKLPRPSKKKNQAVKCLCWSKSGVFISYYSTTTERFLNYQYPYFLEIKGVTHWMPLPKPPTN